MHKMQGYKNWGLSARQIQNSFNFFLVLDLASQWVFTQVASQLSLTRGNTHAD